MKPLIVIALAVMLPCSIAALANPSGVTLLGWPALLVLAVGAYCLQWLAFIPARLGETERFYDLTGSMTYMAITLSAVGVSPSTTWPQWLVAALVIIWAGRLGRFLFERIHQAGGDQRFDHIKVSSSRFLVAWTLQGAWVVMTSCAASP
jgi:steroid 5-alpha reductase family enzyme